MPLHIMQNIYPASWFYLTGYRYVRSMPVKHHLKKIVVVAVVVCLFVCCCCCCFTVFFILSLSLYCFDWYKLYCKYFAELCKVSSISDKVLFLFVKKILKWTPGFTLYRAWLGQHGLCCNTNMRPSFLNTWWSPWFSLKVSKSLAEFFESSTESLKSLAERLKDLAACFKTSTRPSVSLKRVYENLVCEKH